MMDKKKCKHCNKLFIFNPNKQGPPPTYCSASCVVMACRKRKKQKETKVTNNQGKTQKAILRGKVKRRSVHQVDQELFNLRTENKELKEKVLGLNQFIKEQGREIRKTNRRHLNTIYKLKKQMRGDSIERGGLEMSFRDKKR